MSNLLKNSGVFVNLESNAYGKTSERNREMNASEAADIEESVEKKYEKLVWRARSDAFKIITEAEQYSMTLIKKSEETAKTNLAKASEKGYTEGLKKGKEEADGILREKLCELSNLIGTIERQKEEILQKYEEGLKDLALGIARKIIETELQSGDKAFLTLYKSAIQDLGGQEWVKVTVSEDGEQFMTSEAEHLKAMVKGAKSIKINTIKKAPKGTCVVETPMGVSDAGVETQLARISEAFSKEELLA